MSKWVTYEWVLELVNKYDDIVDSEFYSSLALVQRRMAGLDFDGQEPDGDPVRFQWGLTRFDAYEGARGYAYVKNGVLPDEFDNDYKVPKKFRMMELG